jgi:FAD:protein FMN transferase
MSIVPDVTSIWTFEALGCPWTITTRSPLPDATRQRLAARAECFDRTWSRFRPDSLITRIARAEHGDTFVFGDDAESLFHLYDALYVATDGAIDPLIGRDLELLGYDASYSLKIANATIMSRDRNGRPDWHADISRDGRELRTRRPLLIDVGAAGKGHLADLLGDILRECGVTGAVVDASGDIRCFGTSAKIGLEDPHNSGHAIGIAELSDGALCASAPDRRRWGPGIHHLLDARTGRPTQGVAATWVAAETAAIADGIATALFVAEPAALTDLFAFEWLVMTDERIATSSPGFPGELFPDTNPNITEEIA